ncbi:Putative zinc-finger [Abditibacterium utsteinense]|uniref:Zinc-finger n=1 Tax=Abditibacterium utsteinense TaxID=1960156 RepID=A0A2S8SS67_9BACT|nr:zf-HC2 domain-containing protein [Abditibacterium utsteinense]PQV63653.1 Putative zinc-finger [Abditibacterium utsteinense]
MQTSRGDFSKHPKNDDCNALAPLVMALFDGETNELETRRARAHLLVCPTCAKRWLDWNHSRDLLRVPFAPPPPMLLWRVLMACRLAEFSRHAPVRNSRFSLRQKLPQTQSDAPIGLSAQILARTSRPAPPLLRRNPSIFSLLKMPSLAAPALAILLMTLQHDIAWTPAVAPELETSPRVISPRTRLEKTPRRATTRQARAIFTRADSSLPAPRAAVPATMAARFEEKESNRAPRNEARVEFHDDARVPAPQSRFSAESAAPHLREISFGSQPFSISESRLERDEKSESTKNQSAALRRAPREIVRETAKARAAVSPVSSRSAMLRRAEFAFSASGRVPNLRAAGWKNGAAPADENIDESRSWSAASNRAVRGAGRRHSFPSPGAPQLLRVSLPTSEQTTFPPARLLADDFENDDNRVEEMRSVVDDFRATLAPDDSPAAEDDESAN